MKKYLQGFSLIELMIAITLGIILMTGIIQVFFSSKAAFSSQQAISRVQESGRLAVEFISRDIRMAGFLGCSSKDGTAVNVLNNPGNFKNDWLTFIRGYRVTSSSSSMPSAADSGITHAPIVGTDMLVIRGALMSGAVTSADSTDTTLYSELKTTETAACSNGSSRFNGLCVSDVVVEADCAKATVFQITGITAASVLSIAHLGPGNQTLTWGGEPSDPTNTYQAGSEILKMNRVIYFIAKGTSGRPTLFQNIMGTDTELLDGVESMRLTYGVDNSATPDGIPDDYYSSDVMTTAQWSKVLSVKVQILVQSAEDNVVAEKQKYTFAGTTKTASDKRLRQIFNTTVGIRSKLP